MTRGPISALVRLCLLLVAGAATAHASEAGFALIEDPAHALGNARDSDEGRAVLDAAHHYLRWAPQAQPTVHVEGSLGTRDFEVVKDWPRMLALAIAWRLSTERSYLEQTERYFGAWLDTFELSQHAVSADPACLSSPVPAGTRCMNPIDDAELTSFILAYDVARPDLDASTRGKMGDFMRNLARSYLDDIALRRASSERRIRENEASNWQSHRIALATLAAFLVGDTQLIEEAHRAFREQLERNIGADGSVYDFHTRDALHYVVYDLDPLVNCALAAQAHGQDWYHDGAPAGASLGHALGWLLPYAAGETTHEEFLHSTVAFDRARAAKGWTGYSGAWDPSTARTLFRKAVHLDRALATPAIVALDATSAAALLEDFGRSKSDPLIGILYR